MMKVTKINFSEYYRLTKPGIIKGNLFTAVAAFLFASRGNIDLSSLFGIVAGTILVIASGCVFNNIIDRNIDKKMERTKNRALASGKVSVLSAMIYATILGIAGLVVLFMYTNPLTAWIGLFGLFAYVVLYGIAKRKTTYGTIIGSISGAIPPLAGYTAATNTIDTAGILLFLILAFWQMPHFYAIAMYRLKDYRKAGIPVLPSVIGMKRTKSHIFIFIVAFMIACSLLWAYGYAPISYLLIILALCAFWIFTGIKEFHKNDIIWAKKMFFVSLIVLTLFSATISVSNYMP